MSNNIFLSLIAIIAISTTGFIFIKEKDKPVDTRPGMAHKDEGRKHVAEGSKQYGGQEPPTSGDHGSSVPWQQYNQEIPDSNVIHNMEHGGVYVSYRPDLPADQIAQLKALFFKPYSSELFAPNKVILAPRAANDAPIILSSWKRSEKFSNYDELKFINYYKKNVGKSPEPTAS